MAENTSTTQFISSIKQEDGKISISRSNAGTLVLGNEYNKINNTNPINTNDSINSAIGKLEYKVDILRADAS
jgi:hypothetical protein